MPASSGTACGNMLAKPDTSAAAGMSELWLGGVRRAGTLCAQHSVMRRLHDCQPWSRLDVTRQQQSEHAAWMHGVDAVVHTSGSSWTATREGLS
jgi:hypothetical protein